MVYILTFSTYGVHLPGDERGSYNHVREGRRRFFAPSTRLEAFAREKMRQPKYDLSSAAVRVAMRDSIVGVCRFRGWNLFALHIRVSRVHAVVETIGPASRILSDFKAYATRALREQGLEAPGRLIWAHGGSAHELSNRDAVSAPVFANPRPIKASPIRGAAIGL